MKLRDKLLSKGGVKKEVITITADDGETMQVEVRGLGSMERGRLMTQATTTSDDGESSVVDLAKLSPQLVISCAYDPETGERLFSEADVEVLGELSATFLDPIINAASRLSGMSKSAVKEAEGNSGATVTSASASPSPES
jgi:hypothetical protein